MNNENGNSMEDSLLVCVADLTSSLVVLDDLVRVLKNAHMTDASVHRSAAYNTFIADKWDSLENAINSIWVYVYDLDYILKK